MTSTDDHDMSTSDLPTPWPFEQPPDCAVNTTTFVVHRGETITHVNHGAYDHGWQFYSSGKGTIEDVIVVSLATIVRLDPSILELADLPPGWQAFRNAADEDWVRATSIYEYPGYDECMKLLAMNGDPDEQEGGYQMLLPVAGMFADELLEDLDRHGGLCRIYIIELLGHSTSPAVVARLEELMYSDVQSDSEIAQEALWYMWDDVGKPLVREYRRSGGRFAADYMDGTAD
ncbi:MAG: hypothetical protein R3F34_19235 [Planctomycetota bacterium]